MRNLPKLEAIRFTVAVVISSIQLNTWDIDQLRAMIGPFTDTAIVRTITNACVLYNETIAMPAE